MGEEQRDEREDAAEHEEAALRACAHGLLGLAFDNRLEEAVEGCGGGGHTSNGLSALPLMCLEPRTAGGASVAGRAAGRPSPPGLANALSVDGQNCLWRSVATCPTSKMARAAGRSKAPDTPD